MGRQTARAGYSFLKKNFHNIRIIYTWLCRTRRTCRLGVEDRLCSQSSVGFRRRCARVVPDCVFQQCLGGSRGAGESCARRRAAQTVCPQYIPRETRPKRPVRGILLSRLISSTAHPCFCYHLFFPLLHLLLVCATSPSRCQFHLKRNCSSLENMYFLLVFNGGLSYTY